MIPRTTLEIAAFWAQSVCIQCEAIQPPDEEASDLGDEPPACCNCGAAEVLPAETILAIADMVGEGE